MNDRSYDRVERQSFATPPGFETEQVAEQRSAELIARLERRRTPGRKEDSMLLSTLRNCGASTPCGSAACPKCNRKFRLRLHRQVQEIVPRSAEILAISMIPRPGRVELDQLSAFDFKTWVTSRQRGLARALPEEALLISGADISLNTWENSDAHWCFHLYGLIVLPCGWGVERKRQRARLRKAIADHCPLLEPIEGGPNERPLLLKQFARADLGQGFLYGYKSQFYKRSRFAYQKRNTATRSSNATPQSLPIDREIDLVRFLGRHCVGSRLLLVGVRRQGDFANFQLTLSVTRQSSG